MVSDLLRGVVLKEDPNLAFPRRLHIKDRPPENFLAREQAWGCHWMAGDFRLAAETTPEQLATKAGYYMKKYEDTLRAQGFKVISMRPPRPYRGLMPVPADQKRFVILALVSRRPQEVAFDIPDQAVPEVEKLGLRLTE